MAYLSPTTTSRAPASPRQMGRTCRKEKQSARTVRPKTRRAKYYKKGAAKPERTFLGKEKYMRFAASRCWKITIQGQRNEGQYSIKGKTSLDGTQKFFSRDSDSECSACLSGLLTYIVPPCTPSSLTSHCQLTPPDPLPLATELIQAAAVHSTCPACPVPDMFCAAAAAAAAAASPRVRVLLTPSLRFPFHLSP
jgi:hypothetical protein